MNKTESVHTPTPNQEKKHSFKDFVEAAKSVAEKYTLKAGATLALGAVALTGCSANTEATLSPSSQEQVATSPSSEEVVKEPNTSEEEPTELDLQIERSKDLFDTPKPERFDEFKSMELAAFQALPIEDRLDYAMYLNRDAEINAELFHMYTENPKDILPEVISPENTATEISTSTHSLFRGSITMHFGALDGQEGYSTVKYDTLDRQKILSAAFLSPIDNSIFNNWNTSVSDDESSGHMPFIYASKERLLADEVATDASSNYTVVDPWGTERVARDITLIEPDGQTFQGTQILIQTDNYSQWING